MVNPVSCSALLLLLLCVVVGCRSSKQKTFPTSKLTSADLARLDVELAGLHRQMEESWPNTPDSLTQHFEQRLDEILADPGTLNYPFDSLQATRLWIVGSSDGTMRIFNWLAPHIELSRDFPARIQARTRSGTYIVKNVEEFGSPDIWPMTAYHSIYRLDDSTLLALGSGVLMPATVPYEIALCFRLNDQGITGGPALFRQPGVNTPRRFLYVDKLWYERNFMKFTSGIPFALHYDSTSRELFYPEIVVEGTHTSVIEAGVTGNPVPSGDTIRLHFNGRFFE